jgi:hypothetical protein
VLSAIIFCAVSSLLWFIIGVQLVKDKEPGYACFAAALCAWALLSTIYLCWLRLEALQQMWGALGV